MEEATRIERCVRCGTSLPPDSKDDLCAACSRSLSDSETVISGSSASATDDSTMVTRTFGTASGSDDATVLSSYGGTVIRGSRGPHPEPDHAFGPYHVIKLLGRGGMGDVYEAEHVEHGRRVAIKVLNRRLAGSDDRARFLREGELAASIGHPNTVYVYGSEEISNSPVISMELLSGGTLKDLVLERGPLPPKQAVDYLLQVVAGLEAAHKAGILHRDIKPANCFIDRDGKVKIGDFGLSIASTGRESGASGVFQGTPQFAAPEQLRGDALDVRADIYAVGATLFYLLTGQPPFNDTDLTTLIGRVKEEQPRSPREMRAGVPAALAEIVTRCLAKNRDDRPPNYVALADQLRAFSSTAPMPAGLIRRTVAGFIDEGLVVLGVMPLATLALLRHLDDIAILSLFKIAVYLIYFTILEGRWGASIGKRICGLRVRRLDGQRLTFPQALARVAIFQTPSMPSMVVTLVFGASRVVDFDTAHPFLAVLLSLTSTVVLIALFSTARRRNGFAAVQDLATGTRVIRHLRHTARGVPDMAPDPLPATGPHTHRYGPFEVIGTLGPTETGELLVAVDPRLKRRVWIHDLPPGSAAIAAHLRDLARPSRLRWLGGRRTDAEAWDAYDASDGRPLVELESRQSWPLVKRWALDLATEIHAGLADASLTSLAVDRVWITRDGHARLLDFRAPGDRAVASDAVMTPTMKSAQPWLAAVAQRGLAGRAAMAKRKPGKPLVLPEGLPLSARTMLDKLTAQRFNDSGVIVSDLTSLLSHTDEVPPSRRIWSVVLGGLFPVVLAALGLVVTYIVSRIPADVPALAQSLTRLSKLEQDHSPAAARERHDIEIYVASHFGPTIANPITWTVSTDKQDLKPLRPIARRIMADHPKVSPEEAAAATANLDALIAAQPEAIRSAGERMRVAKLGVPLALFLVGLGIAGVSAMAWAIVLGNGFLLRLLGIAIVNKRSERASRLRVLLRTIVAWGPAGVAVYFGWRSGINFDNGLLTIRSQMALNMAIASAVIFLIGAAWAMRKTQRGIQDVVAGTWLVPR